MSDPLSIAAGVIGVVTAAAQISSILINFTKSTIAAPRQAQVVLTEVSHISAILSQLQSYLFGLDFPDRSRTSLLKVDKLVTVISGCVLTFSELEKLLDEFKTEGLDVLDRLKWVRKESAIMSLIQRLQNHKASLSLVLSILNGHTIVEAKDSVDRLHVLVEQCYKEMSSRIQALEVLDVQHRSHADWMSGDDTESLRTIHTRRPDLNPEKSFESELVPFDFSDDLQRSRVYKRNQAFRGSIISALTNSVYSLGWSFFSDLSMAEVSNISVINLVITEEETFNPQRSSQTWSAQPKDGISTGPSSDKYRDRQQKQLNKVVRKPAPANDFAFHWVRWGRWPGATQIQHESVPHVPLMEYWAAFSCKGCGEILEEGKVFELAGNRWHIDCFQCNTCGTSLDSNADLLLLGDGSLVCNNCTYSCSVCNNKIGDLAILTGDQAFCAQCFKCRKCKQKIEDMRYTRTSQGIFCMECHESLMQRRRRKARKTLPENKQPEEGSPNSPTNVQHGIDKELPMLPPAETPLLRDTGSRNITLTSAPSDSITPTEASYVFF